jgi:glycerol kinase
MKKYILSIDQGTTGSTVVIFNSLGRSVGKGYNEFRQIYPQPGWVEHNPKDILDSVQASIQQALEVSQIDVNEIAAIGITNQRETIVSWNPKTNKTNYNAIVWQCRRTSAFTEKLKKNKTLSQKIFKTTGLVLDPYFSSSKMRWLVENKKLSTNDYVGTIDSYLIWTLTGGQSFTTDVTNASRTQLMNLKTLKWDQSLLKLFKVSEKSLPEILPSNAHFGVTQGYKILPDGIPIHGVVGDQQSALFGQGAFQVGEAKCTFGTGSFILMNIGEKIKSSKNKILTTVAWQLQGQKPKYAFEGGAFICGAAVQFLRDQFKFFKNSDEVESMALKANPKSEVLCVPAFSGLGAPYWDPQVRAAYMGLTRGDGREEICYATLESMAMQNAVILEAMQKDSGTVLKQLNVDGGAVKNNLLMQLQSDLLQKKVLRPEWIETTVLGAALMSGLGSGFWSEKTVKNLVLKNKNEYKPKQTKAWQKTKRIRWDKAVLAVKQIK